MLLVPFYEKVDGLPDRKIDVQVWLHQLTEHEVTYANPQQVVDMGHTAKQTKVFRAHVDPAIISCTYRQDFLKGNKATMRTALALILGDKAVKQVLDLWSPSLTRKGTLSPFSFVLAPFTLMVFLNFHGQTISPSTHPLKTPPSTNMFVLRPRAWPFRNLRLNNFLRPLTTLGHLLSRASGP